MQLATINGVTLRYEVLGDSGPWMALSPGGRHEMGNVRPLAQKMAAAGYRVLIHDRRNCGASEVAFDGAQPEYEIWADDLAELLKRLDARPVIVGGGSSGARLAILYALNYASRVKALLLWRVTGGPFAVQRLAENYYGQYIRAAEQGGMAAVAATEHFAQRIVDNPRNRHLLNSVSAAQFIATMKQWRTFFEKSADLPVVGATEAELNSIKVPTCIIPGNDKTHSHVTGGAAHRMIPNSELHDLWPGDLDIDLFPAEDWAQKEAEQAAIFVDFLKRKGLGP
jgi:pimeloyl-ACP methyl ester carboxylesterase